MVDFVCHVTAKRSLALVLRRLNRKRNDFEVKMPCVALDSVERLLLEVEFIA